MRKPIGDPAARSPRLRFCFIPLPQQLHSAKLRLRHFATRPRNSYAQDDTRGEAGANPRTTDVWMLLDLLPKSCYNNFTKIFRSTQPFAKIRSLIVEENRTFSHTEAESNSLTVMHLRVLRKCSPRKIIILLRFAFTQSIKNAFTVRCKQF